MYELKIITFVSFTFIKNILLLSQYLRIEGRNHDICFAKICEIENEKGRKLSGREFAKLSSSLRQQGHICSLLFHYWIHVADHVAITSL